MFLRSAMGRLARPKTTVVPVFTLLFYFLCGIPNSWANPPNINATGWTVWHGENAVGDGAWQAGVKDKKQSTAIYIEGCDPNSVNITDDNLGNYHQEDKEGSMKRTSWLKFGNPEKDAKITLRHELGWSFDIKKRSLFDALLEAENFYICARRDYQRSDCLSFTTKGMRTAVEELCRKAGSNASLDHGGSNSIADCASDDKGPINVDAELNAIRSTLNNNNRAITIIQLILARTELYSDAIDGKWGQSFEKSLYCSLQTFIAIHGRNSYQTAGGVAKYMDWLYAALESRETGTEFPD